MLVFPQPARLMNYLQFIASLIHSLAWPAAVIVLAAAFRKPLKELFQNLNRFKYGKVEIDFRRELDQLETYAKTIDLKPPPKQISAEPRTAEQILNEAAQLTADFPEPAVALGWTAIEHELGAAMMRLGLRSDHPSPSRQIEALRKDAHLDNETFEILQRMRNLRNMALHGGAIPGISSGEAVEFLAFAAGVVQRLQDISSKK